MFFDSSSSPAYPNFYKNRKAEELFENNLKCRMFLEIKDSIVILLLPLTEMAKNL